MPVPLAPADPASAVVPPPPPEPEIAASLAPRSAQAGDLRTPLPVVEPSAALTPGERAALLDRRDLGQTPAGTDDVSAPVRPALTAAGIALAIGLAVAGQSALLRTRGPLPAVALFAAACLLGGWTAIRAGRRSSPVAELHFPLPSGGRGWLVAALAGNVGCLVLFGSGFVPTVAWVLFTLSVAAAALTFWSFDGRPRLRVAWRAEWPWLAALAVITLAGAGLRLAELGSLPFGLWYDEAYSGLQVQRILTDPGFRPVYVGGLAQEPSLLWYLMAISVKVFGPTALALRLPAAVAGIMGIPAIYLLGRELFGRRTAIIAAGLLATLVWHLTFSRIGFNSEWSVTLDAAGLFFLVRAWKKASWTAAGLAGISLGLGLHMYYTSRLMVVVATLAVAAWWLAHPRRRFRAGWRIVATALFAGVVTASPLIEFALQHPNEFNSRLQQASVFTEVRDQHSYAPIVDNVRAHLLMFNLAGDRNARHNLPGQPELNFLLGGLFVLGLGISLARARRGEYLLLPVWGLAMLAGGVFSVAFEAPQSLRTIDEINVVVLLCSLPLALLWQACDGLAVPRKPLVRAAAPAAVDEAAGTPIGARSWLRARAPLALLPLWASVAVWQTDPLYRHLLTAIPGGMDAPHFLWSAWWMKYALLNLHQWPLTSDYLFAPQGVNLAFHAAILLPALLTVPLQGLLGLFGALNLVFLGSLVATSATAYLLVKQETGSSWGAFVGSLVFTYAPYKTAHLSAGHLNVVMTWAVPLFALFLLRWLRARRIRDAVAAGVSLGLVGLVDLNHLTLSVLLGAALCAGFAVRRKWAWRMAPRLLRDGSRWLVGLALIAATGAVVLAPVLASLVQGLREGWSTSVPLNAPDGWSPDVISYVVPLPMSPWLAFGADVARRFHFLDPARLVFVGYVALGLSILGLWSWRKGNAQRWWLVALAFWLFSLGPRLHLAGQTSFSVGGRQFEVPLPFALYHRLPLLGGLSVPGYASLVVMLALAVLSGHGLHVLSRRGAYAWLLAPVLGALVLLESTGTPLALFSPTPDPVYGIIGSFPGRQAVLVAPAGWTTELGALGEFDMREMYFATLAQKPIVSGHVARAPARLLDFYRQQPALRVLLFPAEAATPASGDAQQVTAALHRLGVGYIVLHHWQHFDQQLAYVTGTLRYPGLYQDDEVAAFRVPAS